MVGQSEAVLLHTLDSLISVGLCLLISRIFSRVYDLIREVFSIAIGIKFEIFNFSSKLSVIQHYFCFFCKISRVYAYFSGQIFQRLCLFKGLCLLESLEYWCRVYFLVALKITDSVFTNNRDLYIMNRENYGTNFKTLIETSLVFQSTGAKLLLHTVSALLKPQS